MVSPAPGQWTESTYLNEMPYWATLSNPFFHTSVTSQALVACSRHDKNADVPLPPTVDCEVSKRPKAAPKVQREGEQRT
jgi:hypothetical protein